MPVSDGRRGSPDFLVESLPAGRTAAAATASPVSGSQSAAAAAARNVANQHLRGAHASNATSEGQGRVEVATETHVERSGGRRGGGAAARGGGSILPEMWRALTPDLESDGEAEEEEEEEEEELFSRDGQAGVSLLGNGVSKSYR